MYEILELGLMEKAPVKSVLQPWALIAPAKQFGLVQTVRCISILGTVLLVCLWQILGSTVLIAQSDTSTSVMVVKGPYKNLAENHRGQFELERKGSAVFATFGTTRSPVQFFARQGAEVLLTIPEGYRPVTAITWEVNARHVQADGLPHPTRTEVHVFNVSVDTEGRVRYVNDSGVDGVEYLRYETAVAWPLAETEPLVCERSGEMQNRILAALDGMEEAVRSCAEVTWAHLLRIHGFPSQEPMEISGDDLLGLTNLTELQMRSRNQATLPFELLAHTPHLQEFNLVSYHLNALPTKFFGYTPRLASLSLNIYYYDGAGFLEVLDELLAHTPHLKSLHLENSGLEIPLMKLLEHTPQLTHLNVHGTVGGYWSFPEQEMQLSSTSTLTHLSVKGWREICLPADFLDPVPELSHLELELWAPVCLPQDLLANATELKHLGLQVNGLERLAPDFLANLPNLTYLGLDVSGMTVFPIHLLAQTPNLTHLRLHDSDEQRAGSRPEGLTLPEQLFSSTPHLLDLELDVKYLNNIPVELLAQVPRLKHLKLDGGNVESLPPRLLSDVPDLTSLELELEIQTSLPSDLLDSVPELKDLTIAAGQVSSLPYGFLDEVPKLTELSLLLNGLETLPDDFLSHPQRLQSLYLGDGGIYDSTRLRFLPEHFLSYAPSLTKLVLDTLSIPEFPTSFLAHAPRLEHFELISYTLRGLARYGITSLPENFLAPAPNLTYLDLAPLGNVEVLPTGFLANSPQLKHLSLFVPKSISLPDGFLGNNPSLETVSLDAGQVDELPTGFLTNTPRLQFLKIDVGQVEAFPEGFLADTPRLEHLEIRADNVGMLPDGFLSQIPQIREMGLGMPNLVSPPRPGEPLWEKLEATSPRVIVSSPQAQDILADSGYCPGNFVLEKGELLEVIRREPDGQGNTLLTAYPWRDRDLFITIYGPRGCPIIIDAKYTEPTLDV